MAGSHGSELKKYTEDAEIVSPLDWNKLVLAVEALQTEDYKHLEHFSGYDASGNTILSTDWVDIPMDVTSKMDTDSFSHSGGTGEVTVLESNFYDIIAECGFKSDDVAVIEIRIVRDIGDGYVEIPGSKGFCSM